MRQTSYRLSYLEAPRSKPNYFARLRPLQIFLSRVLQTNPRLLARLTAGLILWTIGVGSIDYILHNRELPNQTGLNNSVAFQAPNASSTPLVSKAVTPAKAAVALPSGPTGQLLPPGTMAPDKTYANSYTRGQCTWYVAGRRQIPANWGNAISWYYHANSSKWAVGTVPAIGAIAWTSTGRGGYGHVALVEQVSSDGKRVYISEMNYRGPYIKSHRWVSATAFKYIY